MLVLVINFGASKHEIQL